MPWFVPTDGDRMMCAVGAPDIATLTKPGQPLLQLSVRVEWMLLQEPEPQREKVAVETGDLLYAAGAIGEAVDSLRELMGKVDADPYLWDFLESNGLTQEYRPATPDEARTLESLRAREWASLFQESSLQ